MSFEVEFGTKTAADAARDEFDEYVCPLDDDRRLKTVAFVDDTPEDAENQIRRNAEDSRAERMGGAGQVPLTDAEKEKLDFSEANIMHARSAKGIARSEGVDDWLSWYDSDLSVDEHRGLYTDAKTQETGRRLDAEDSATEKAASASRTAANEECDHARGHCEHGDPDACEFLREQCGYDEDEVESILDEDDVNEDEITGKAAGGLGRAWQGYKAGIARLERELEDALEAKANAEEAAAAINAIRADHGQNPLEFDVLEDLSDSLAAVGDVAHDAQGHIENQS